MKGTKPVIHFMLEIKGIVDELDLLGLDDSYKELSHAIQAHDTVISFDELHEKLLSMEVQLASRAAILSTNPTTTFYTAPPRQSPSPQHGRFPGPHQQHGNQPPHFPQHSPDRRPILRLPA